MESWEILELYIFNFNCPIFLLFTGYLGDYFYTETDILIFGKGSTALVPYPQAKALYDL